jgi:D-alanyl-D-alanine carboxypeptidase
MPPEYKNTTPDDRPMVPDYRIPPPDIQIAPSNPKIKPPTGRRLKILISVCILLLVIGFINTAMMREQSTIKTGTPATSAGNSFLGIDSSFFNFNTQSLSSSTSSHQISTLNQLSTFGSNTKTKASAPGLSPSSNILSSSNPHIQAQIPANLITADSYLVGNLATGKIYFEKDPTAIRPIASISKLVTAMIVQKNIDPNKEIVISSSSVTGYEQHSDVNPDEAFSVSDLLTGMLLISSNDAALAFANDYGYAAFMSLMNASASSIGMDRTSFEDPSGLSSGNVSSANDLFKLARYLYANDPDILTMTKIPELDLATTTEHNSHNFVNINPFVYDPHYIGGKTGNTAVAGDTMLSLFDLTAKNGANIPIAIVVLHSDLAERQVDSSILVGKVLGLISGN